MKKTSTIVQFAKFVLVGALNTAVDFMVLNALFLVFSSHKDSASYLIFKSISFVVAVINSYYLNKYWVFAKKVAPATAPNKNSNEKTLFFVVSVIGFAVNVLVSTLVFTVANKTFPGHHTSIANISALVGTVVVLGCNFVCYKFLVFKKN